MFLWVYLGMFKHYIDYIKDNPKHYWFKAKLYGWGWTPATWQGWVVLGSYIVLVLFFGLTLDPTSPPREVAFTFLIPVAFLTISLIRICYKTGEKPRWQWGLSLDTDKQV
jgi:hypothetical protein